MISYEFLEIIQKVRGDIEVRRVKSEDQLLILILRCATVQQKSIMVTLNFTLREHLEMGIFIQFYSLKTHLVKSVLESFMWEFKH